MEQCQVFFRPRRGATICRRYSTTAPALNGWETYIPFLWVCQVDKSKKTVDKLQETLTVEKGRVRKVKTNPPRTRGKQLNPRFILNRGSRNFWRWRKHIIT